MLIRMVMRANVETVSYPYQGVITLDQGGFRLVLADAELLWCFMPSHAHQEEVILLVLVVVVVVDNLFVVFIVVVLVIFLPPHVLTAGDGDPP